MYKKPDICTTGKVVGGYRLLYTADQQLNAGADLRILRGGGGGSLGRNSSRGGGGGG